MHLIDRDLPGIFHDWLLARAGKSQFVDHGIKLDIIAMKMEFANPHLG